MQNVHNVAEIDKNKPMRGTVMDTADPSMEGRVAVHIPKLMTKTDPNKIARIVETMSLSKDFILNEDLKPLLESSIKITNTMWARPKYNNSFMVPYVGQTVEVFMEDGDPNKLYYNPLEVSLNGQVIDMEFVKHVEDTYDYKAKPFIHVFYEFKDATIMYYNENIKHKRFELRFKNNHSFNINENLEEDHIELVTSDKHRVILDTKNKHITIHTHKGHKIFMDDVTDKIHITTVGKHSILMDDPGKKIKITSGGNHDVLLDDASKTLKLQSSGGHVVNMSDGSGTINISASTGGTAVIGSGLVRLN